MTQVAVNGHKLAETRFCRKPNCANEVRAGTATVGRWANLCEEHYEDERRRSAAEKTGSLNPNSERSRLANQGDFERKAKDLVLVGRRLDRAVAQEQLTRTELQTAMADWRRACRALAGEES